MKVTVRITGEARTGVSRKQYDGVPTKAEVDAQVADAMAQTLEDFAKPARKTAKTKAK